MRFQIGNLYEAIRHFAVTRLMTCQAPARLFYIGALAALPAFSQSFTATYCVACHSAQSKTAGLSLEGLDPAHPSQAPAIWEKVLVKMRTGQMPPAGLPRPDPETYTSLVSQIEKQLDADAAAHPDPGTPAIHRLNRFEYQRVIHDLLAVDIDAASLLPGDDSGYGFDNIADVLSMSPVLLEKYLSAARQISRLAVGDMSVKPVESEFVVPLGTPTDQRANDDLPFDSRGGWAIRYRFPVDGEYVLRVTTVLEAVVAGRLPDRGQHYDVRVPVKAGMRLVGVAYPNKSEVAELVAPAPTGKAALAGFVAGPAGAVPMLDLRLDDARVKLIEPAGIAPAVYSIAILGPYNPTGPGNTTSRSLIFTCKPASAAEERPCARKILNGLARRAFRRPVTDADISPLMGFYDRARTKGTFDTGIQSALQAMLVSPGFLFRSEGKMAAARPGDVVALNDNELASRLSFFMWSTMPDDRLLDLAQAGKLHEPAVLSQEVTRMLADSRSDALVTNFAGQWLYLRNLSSVRPDPDVFPEFDAELRSAFQQETEMLFKTILREDRSITELLSAKYTFLNERLARHYGIQGVNGPAFRRVELTDENRMGLLGQGSLLTVTSDPNRTSVVQRGKWILENLLGTPPPPPPPDVPALKPHGSDGKMTLRQAMEQHRANPVCASCHSRMDPLGFSLENFDGVGKWRTRDDTGGTIDSSGTLPDGTSFNGPAGLTKLLLNSRKRDFLDTVTAKLLTYSLGRGLEYYDEPAVRTIIREAARDDYRLSSLIQGIVNSVPFRMRRVPEL